MSRKEEGDGEESDVLEGDLAFLQEVDVTQCFEKPGSDSDTSEVFESGNSNNEGPSKPRGPTTRSGARAREDATQTDPHKGSQTEKKPRKRPRSPRQLPLTGEPPQKMTAMSTERADHLEDLIRAIGQSQAATNAILGRLEKGQDMILTALQELTPRIVLLENRTQALQEARKEEFIQAMPGPSRQPQPEMHTQTPHIQPPGGLGAIGIF